MQQALKETIPAEAAAAVEVVTDLHTALASASADDTIGNIYVIGGGSVYTVSWLLHEESL